jgi:biopolymer transport protein ExbD
MLSKRKARYEEDEMELTSLIDCVFLLLIFFMVTTVFKNPQQFKLTLPEAEQAVVVEEKKLTLEISSEGKMALNGRLVTLVSLGGYIRSEKGKVRSGTIIIKADKITKHGLVLNAMRAAKEAGISTIILASEKKIQEAEKIP